MTPMASPSKLDDAGWVQKERDRALMMVAFWSYVRARKLVSAAIAADARGGQVDPLVNERTRCLEELRAAIDSFNADWGSEG